MSEYTLRNINSLDPAILTPDGGIIYAMTRADAERIVWELNRWFGAIRTGGGQEQDMGVADALSRLMRVVAQRDKERESCEYDWGYFGYRYDEAVRDAERDFIDELRKSLAEPAVSDMGRNDDADRPYGAV